MMPRPVEPAELIKQLAALRVSRGITQTQIAQCIGTTQSAVARLESGRHDPQFSTLVRYAAALGVTVSLTAVPVPGPVADAPLLTPMQAEILEIITTGREQGRSPSLREIGDAVGLSSVSSVSHHLDALEGMGYIRRYPQRQRAIELLPPPGGAPG